MEELRSGRGRRASDRPEGSVDSMLLAERITFLHDDVAEMKSAIRELAQAVTKLALVEERLSNAALAQERMFAALDALEKRTTKLERDQPTNAQTHTWVERAILIAAGAAVIFAWAHVVKG